MFKAYETYQFIKIKQCSSIMLQSNFENHLSSMILIRDKSVMELREAPELGGKSLGKVYYNHSEPDPTLLARIELEKPYNLEITEIQLSFNYKTLNFDLNYYDSTLNRYKQRSWRIIPKLFISDNFTLVSYPLVQYKDLNKPIHANRIHCHLEKGKMRLERGATVAEKLLYTLSAASLFWNYKT